MVGFIFGGNTGETPETLARKRAIVAQIMGSRNAPRNVGEGLNAIGDGIVANVLNRRADRGDAAGQESASAAFNPLLDAYKAKLSGGFPAAPNPGDSTSMASMAAPDAASARVAQAHGDGGMSAYQNAIASIESAGSGDYNAVGPAHKTLGRALGKYQVMEANIGPWSEKHLGRRITADEFMQNPQFQDEIFNGEFGSYADKYGPEGAAQAWFGGEGGVGKLNRKDSLGTSIGAYTDKFRNALGGTPPAVAANEAMATGGLSSGLTPEMLQQWGAANYADPMPPEMGGVPVAENEADILAQEQAMMGQDPMAFQQAGMQPRLPQQMPQAAPPMSPPQMVPDMPVAGMHPQQRPPMQPQPGGFPEMAGQSPQAIAAPGPDMNMLLQAASNPWLSEQQRSVVNMMLQQQMQQQDPMRQMQLEKGQLEIDALRNPVVKQTDTQRNLEWRAQQAGLQPGTPQYQQFMATGGSDKSTNITVNTGEGDKFYENLDKKNAETFSGLSEAGVSGRSKMSQIDRLDELLKRAPQGASALLKQAAGEYGIETEGLSDIQASQALINELVPQQRQPGSGPMSDADLALFKQSLPRLINQPEGNRLILDTMRGITRYQIQMGDIADLVADREISPAEGRKMIRELANPLGEFGERASGFSSTAPASQRREIGGYVIEQVD